MRQAFIKIILPLLFFTALIIGSTNDVSANVFSRRTDHGAYTQKVMVIHFNNSQHIYGQLYLPKRQPMHKTPAVILSHGLGGTHEQMTAYAESLAEHGFIAYTFDFRGGSAESQSSGSTTHMSVFSEEKDLQQAISHVKSLHQVNPKQISLVGASQGGVVSALTAAKEGKAIHKVALVYPAFSIVADARKQYSSLSQVPSHSDIWGVTVGKNYYRNLLSLNLTKTVTQYPNPILIIHGTDDNVVPISYSKKMASSYSNASFIKLKGAGHDFSGKYREKAIKEIVTFLQN